MTDVLLSRSSQAIIMPVFPMLKIDCPICQAYKVNQPVPILDGTHKTRNSAILNRNNAQLAQELAHAITRTSNLEDVTSLKSESIGRKNVKSV